MSSPAPASSPQRPATVDLQVSVGSISLKNPVIAASGTFGYGVEFAHLVNLDSLGTGPTKFEMDRADQSLAEAFQRVASTFKLPLNVVNAHKVGRSDSDSFQDRKVPTINIHSLTQETFPILHTQRDRMDAIHFDDYYDSYLLIRAYLAYLDKVR